MEATYYTLDAKHPNLLLDLSALREAFANQCPDNVLSITPSEDDATLCVKVMGPVEGLVSVLGVSATPPKFTQSDQTSEKFLGIVEQLRSL